MPRDRPSVESATPEKPHRHTTCAVVGWGWARVGWAGLVILWVGLVGLVGSVGELVEVEQGGVGSQAVPWRDGMGSGGWVGAGDFVGWVGGVGS